VKTKGFKEKGWAVETTNDFIGCETGCIYCYARKNAIRRGHTTEEQWTKPFLNSYRNTRKFKKIDGVYGYPSTHNITKNNIDICLVTIKEILTAGNDLLLVLKPFPDVVEKLCMQLQQWKKQIEFRFTITTMDDSIIEIFEPNGPSYEERRIALNIAFGLGYKTSLSIEPYLTVTVEKLIMDLQHMITGLIFVGPMNYFNELAAKYPIIHRFKFLYTTDTLHSIKQAVDSLQLENVRYKDTFLTMLEVQDK